MSLSRRLLIACAVLAVFTPDSSHAFIVDANFTESSYLGGLAETATGMAWAPDGSNRLFVTTQTGSVWIVAHGDIPTPAERDLRLFATIAPIHISGECGLLGLVFDPDFLVNRYVYFFVTVSASEQQIIRYTAAGDVGTNKTVIVAGLPTNGMNHNGGSIGIGPDGKLYWAVGDNGIGRGVNADLASLAAKVGRSNLDGSVPNENPFFDGDGPNADYIWARGLRNPFTMTFQPENGALWLDVVGDNYEQVFVVNRGDHAGYNAYENNQPDGFITPIIKYRTNAADSRDLTASGAMRSASEVTFTTTASHGFRQGEMITIAGVSDTSFNGNVYVASTPSATTFTAIQIGPDATSGNGTAVTQALGGCVTGGTFYAATQFAPAYWGNYFFGDFNSGNIMRAVLSSPATIESVQIWGNVSGQFIDIETGPDGALYYMRTSGEVVRGAFDATVQGLVVSKTHVWMSEGGEQWRAWMRRSSTRQPPPTTRARKPILRGGTLMRRWWTLIPLSTPPSTPWPAERLRRMAAAPTPRITRRRAALTRVAAAEHRVCRPLVAASLRRCSLHSCLRSYAREGEDSAVRRHDVSGRELDQDRRPVILSRPRRGG